MKKIFLTLLALLSISNIAQAATVYYVRVSGGTASQCTGTSNADYSGTGVNQACAFNHPAWAIGTGNVAGKIVGGDTVIIDDNSGTATYMIGYGMPNTSSCSLSGPYDTPCQLRPLPSGTVTAPTRILGSAYATGCGTKPQLWGTEAMGDSVHGLFNASGVNNIDLECMEYTDHSNCGFRTGGNQCSENWNSGTSSGTYTRGPFIYAKGGSNFTFKNLDIHGLAASGMHMGGINGVTMSHVDLTGNHGAGWDGDVGESGTESSFSGNITLDHVRVRFSGCREAYPRTGTFTTGDYTDCVDYPLGPDSTDGLGTFFTGGTWSVTNSEFSHNTSDGFDLLYGKFIPTLNIDKCLFEGNNGNQLKLSAKNLNVTNSIVVANCDYLSLKGKLYNPGSATVCRAYGSSVVVSIQQGGAYKFSNNFIYSAAAAGGFNGSGATLIKDNLGTCNGTETYTYKNNILQRNTTGSGATYAAYYPDATLVGSCLTAFNASTTDHSNIYNFSTSPSGTGNVFTAPLMATAITESSDSNTPGAILSASSPGKGAGVSGVSFWNTSTDYNNFPQNSPVDMGGVQYTSVPVLAQAGQACTATSDCASGTCSNFLCTGSCTAHGAACSGNTCCGSDTCQSSVCATPVTCGDGVIQAGEVCDGSNLNNQTCTQQGFTGGSLTCAADCKSFVTSSCTNTTVFPLTPVLDTFTRANSTGISNTSWTSMAGSFNISSNAAIPVTANATNKYYWNPSIFTADEEVYTTISNKGSNGDCVKMQARYSPAVNTGYSLEVCPGSSQMFVFKEPGEVQLGATISQTMSSGDSAGMGISGSTITVYRKPSAGAWGSLTTRSDTTYTAGGSVAISSFTGAGTPDIKFTNFGGGSLNPITCGNGLKETGEVCDGADLASQTCVTKGFASGTISCATDCNSFVTSSCVSASVCGNNTKETGEVCDGTALNSQTCATLGFSSGTPTCASDCQSFVTTNCVTSGAGVSIIGATVR